MNRQAMISLAQRLTQAPDNAARLLEIGNLAPDAILSPLGLARRSSFATTALTATGIFVVGAAIGAGVALLLAPTTGLELQTKLRSKGERVTRDRRMAREARRAAGQVAAHVAEIQGAKPDGYSPTNHVAAANA